MWCCVFCILAVVGLPYVQADLSEAYINNVTKECCSKGTEFGRTHTSEECKSSVAPDVNPILRLLCILTMEKCCKESNQTCPDGMRRQPPLLNCEDIDECTEEIHLCHRDQNCLNTIGSFECHCKIGFEPYGSTGACVDINECAIKQHTCKPEIQRCDNTIGSYLCIREEILDEYETDILPQTDDPETTSTTNASPSFDDPPPFKPELKGCEEANKIEETKDKTPSTTKPSKTTPPPLDSPPPFKPELDNSSMVVDTRGIPKNETSKINVKPTKCQIGFELHENGVCYDIDECATNRHSCLSPSEVCKNTKGGYICYCALGFRRNLNTRTCDDTSFTTSTAINTPIPPPTIVTTRTTSTARSTPILPRTIGTATEKEYPILVPIGKKEPVPDRSCSPGYQLGNSTCEDIDECLTGETECGPKQLCTNVAGGYLCTCPTGHKLIADNDCEDVDECALAGSMPICSENADCINTVGSYQCRCHTGLRSAPANDEVCVDVDECTENAGTWCEQRCTNTWGSYRCSCRRGYRLNPDNNTCSDIDECSEKSIKALRCRGRCVNEPGSYRCTCPKGYTLMADKRNCVDINECETGEAPCSGISSWTSTGTNEVCLNTRGGYQCHRIVCPSGYQLESKNRCTKIERVCPPTDMECAHQPTTYSYNFITFVSNLYLTGSRVELFTMRGPTWSHAQIRSSFELKLVDVNAPPSVKQKADINSFLLVQSGHQGVVSLVRPLEGPQSIELELSLEVYKEDRFGGIAVAKIFIYVSEYEF